MPFWLDVTVRAVASLAAFFVLALCVGFVEHKVMAHMQGRLGPMYAGGWHGWAQLIADAVKFLQKEDVRPARADKWVYNIAPAVSFVPYYLAWAAVPFSVTLVPAPLDASLLYVLAAMSIGVVGTAMGGWASGSKYSMLGGIRATAQLVSYELPMVLAAASVAMAAGTLSLQGIIAQWSPWWLLWQLPGAIAFFVAATAEIQRTPFDLPIADSEIVNGPFTEYGSLRFAFFLFAEYAGMALIGVLFSVLYLGGPAGPFSDQVGWLWTLLKMFAVAAFFVWMRTAWPRLKPDVLHRISWVYLVPLAVFQLALTAVVVVVMNR